MRNRVFIVAFAGLGLLAGCGGGGTHHGEDAASSPSAAAAGAGTRPLPTTSPRDGSGAPTCATVSYRVTGQGVEITAQVARTPARLNFEADDRDDNPVTGDPRTSGVDHTFTGGHTRSTLVIKGVKSLHHLTVIALNTAQDDSCRAYPR